MHPALEHALLIALRELPPTELEQLLRRLERQAGDRDRLTARLHELQQHVAAIAAVACPDDEHSTGPAASTMLALPLVLTHGRPR